MTRASGGDSGYSLIGVVSFPDCLPFIIPGLYTEVSYYLPWIAAQYGLTLL